MTKAPAVALEEIYDHVRADPFWDHLRNGGIRLVPGIGSYTPKVLLVGEAPGATENTFLKPFCGASGRVLHELMEVAGLQIEDVVSHGSEKHPGTAGVMPANAFITNVLKYRPPGNRTPTRHEIERGKIALRREWSALGRPRVVVALGGTARTALIRGMSGTLGAGKPVVLPHVTIWVMYHPAYPLRQRSLRPTVEEHWDRFGEWLREHGYVE